MSSEGLAFLRDYLAAIWTLFTSWTFPATNVTPAALLLFSTTMIIGIRFVKRFMGFGGGELDYDDGGTVGGTGGGSNLPVIRRKK